MLITASNFSAYLISSGSPLCSATPRQWLCAPGVPQFSASPLEAGQGLPPYFVHLKNCYTSWAPNLVLDWEALLCFCVFTVETSASKRAEISQTYGGVGFCNSIPHCKAGTHLVQDRMFWFADFSNSYPLPHLFNPFLCRLTEGCSFRRKQH